MQNSKVSNRGKLPVENLLYNIVEELIELGLILCDLHPMVILCVTSHSLQRKLFSTQFAGCLATLNHIVAKLELFKVF